MTVEVNAFLCDAAESVQGKIYAMGAGWNQINVVQSFPALHHNLALALTIHVPYTATNQMHKISIHLEDSDGQRIRIGDKPGNEPGELVPSFELAGEFNVGRPPLLPAGDEQVVPLAMTIAGLRVEKPDMYVWVISIDGSETKRLNMRIVKATVVPTLT